LDEKVGDFALQWRFRALRWRVSKSLRYHGATSFAWISPSGIVPLSGCEKAQQMITPYFQSASRIKGADFMCMIWYFKLKTFIDVNIYVRTRSKYSLERKTSLLLLIQLDIRN